MGIILEVLVDRSTFPKGFVDVRGACYCYYRRSSSSNSHRFTQKTDNRRMCSDSGMEWDGMGERKEGCWIRNARPMQSSQATSGMILRERVVGMTE
jgi:hypothetical protein